MTSGTTNLLTNLIGQFMSVIPNLVGAIVVIIIGLLSSKAVSKLVFKVLKRTGIDKLGDRLNDIDIIERMNIRIEISEILARVLYYLMMLFFTVAATDVLNMQVVSALMGDLIMYVPYLLSAAIVMVVGLFIADALRKMTLTTCQSLGIPSAKTIASFVFYFILISVMMSALTQAKINTDFIKQNLSIILGGLVLAFAIGYGLASRHMMANFLASLYSKDRFRVGDTITINGTTGTIHSMDSTTLTLLTADDRRIIVPLSKLTTETVEVH